MENRSVAVKTHRQSEMTLGLSGSGGHVTTCVINA